MKTHYLKRSQIHQSEYWGIQVSPCQSQLIRATSVGCYLNPKRPMKVFYEWVATGKQIAGSELEKLMKRYPICEFQSNEDMAWRAKARVRRARKEPQ